MNPIAILPSNPAELSTIERAELARHEVVIKRNLESFIAAGNALLAIRRERLYRGTHATFEAYCEDRWKMTSDYARKLIGAAEVVGNLQTDTIVSILPATESQARPLAGLPLDQQVEVWAEVVESAPNGKVTAAHVQSVVDEYKEALTIPVEPTSKEKNWITVEEWKALDAGQREVELAAIGNSKFNQQSTDSIEWALWSWNPVTGCLHDCPYCYARDIANHRFPQGFQPTFHPNRLSAPANTPVPDLTNISDPVERIGRRNVFVCSMADLFGGWVPSEWIHAVLKQVADNPQWTFLFLTKFPQGMEEFDFPPNTWIGTSVDKQWAVARAEKAFRKIRDKGYQGVAWLSCEPMLERLTFSSLDMFDWVVVGGSSKSTQTPEFKPPLEWVVHLSNQAKSLELPVYFKTNLLERVREYPSVATGAA